MQNDKLRISMRIEACVDIKLLTKKIIIIINFVNVTPSKMWFDFVAGVLHPQQNKL